MLHPLIPAHPSAEHWSGIATTPTGRIFVYFDRSLNDERPRIAELLLHQHTTPYPSAEWNLVCSDRELLHTFISIQSIRLGADGNLWVLDRGCDTEGCMVKDSAKLVEIDLKKNAVKSVISLNSVLYENSRIKDMRVGKANIFLSDVGEPDLVVVNIHDGTGFRVSGRNGKKVSEGIQNAISDNSSIDKQLADGGQLELSKDGRFLYYLSESGGLRRYETEKLHDLENGAEDHFKKGILIGMVPNGALGMDGEDNLFLIDKRSSRMLKYDINGNISVVLEDSLLSNTEGIWIDNDNFFWLTIDRNNMETPVENEDQVISFPVYLFKISRG